MDRDRRLPAPTLLIIMTVVLAFLVGCTAEAVEGVVVTQVVMVEGEELRVTRLFDQAVDLPVASSSKEEGLEEAVLDIALAGASNTLDPQLATSRADLDLVENLFVGLTRFNHENSTVEPELAESWEVSPDGRRWTFHLRDDIFWIKPGFAPPGDVLAQSTSPAPYRPVVADDVVYAVQRVCDPRTGVRDALVLFIVEGCEAVHSQTGETIKPETVGVRAIDQHTVEFSLTQPASYFETISSMALVRPVPRELVEPLIGRASSWTAPENLVTSGPFVLGTETQAEEQTVLVRNAFWPIPFRGSVDRVNIFWLDAEEAYERWVAKALDVSPLPASRREEIEGDRRLRPRLHLVTNQAVFYLSFNFDSPVFSEPAVRRAFNAAIDRDALMEEVYGSQGMAMRHLSPPGVLGAPPVDLVGMGYNGDWARQEMARSSLKDCSFLPEIRYLVGSTDIALHHAEMLRSMWESELGCPEEKIIIEQVPFGTLLADTRPEAGAARPDLWDLGWFSYFPDAHNWLGDVLHCTESENRQNRSCSEIDRMIEQAATSRSVEERWALYREAERLFFAEDGVEPIAPLFVRGSYVLVHPWLNYQPAHFGGEQFDAYYLSAVDKRLEREQ